MSALPSELWRALSAGGLRPESPKGLDAAWLRATGFVGRLRRRTHAFLGEADRIVASEDRTRTLTDAALAERLAEARSLWRAGQARHNDLPEAMALLREAASRELGLRAFPVQVAGALAIASGCAVEMATGEGKTLVAALAAALAGWRGRGCHIVTANDYLADRDARWMEPFYRVCGVSVAPVTSGSDLESRRAAYGADVTCCTSKEVAADFLRDRLTLGGSPSLAGVIAGGWSGRLDPHRLMLRGLECAIVDEADAVLIDDAGTPLIISAGAGESGQAEAHRRAAALAAQLEDRRDFTIDPRHREVRLTAAGADRLAAMTEQLGGVWSGRRRAEELVTQALSARSLFRRDLHYIVQDGAVVIVDDATGRPMPDRSWRDGLHQAVEAKEGLTITPPKETLARISFQRFFRLYRRLAGVSGTIVEAASELWGVYRLPVVAIPPNRPSSRVRLPDLCFTTTEAKLIASAEEVGRLHEAGRPVLIGARTVAQSERMSEILTARGLPHTVLNATRHREEAEIIARAGEAGRITIATNMAGRGTDIRLGPGVAEMGGLHVLALERHDAARIDRQLFGRAGRQGDPGSGRCVLSLEDDLVRRHAAPRLRRLAESLAGDTGPVPVSAASALFRAAQADAQRLAQRSRMAVLRADDWLDDALGFAGEGV